SRMVGLADVAADEVDGLKKSVLDLSRATGRGPQELANALYEAASSGLDTAQAMDAVTQAARGAAAGLGSSEEVVSLVASATTAYGAANMDASRALDILTQTIREGRADPEELAGTLGRILPVAASLGVSFEEVGGATAYLSNVFGNTNRTVTAMSGIMVKLLSPTAQGRQALLDMGTSMEQLSAAIDERGLMGALDLLRERGFGGNQRALRALFDDVEAFQGITALLGADQEQLAGIMERTADSAGAASSAFATATETDGFRMRQAWADIQTAMIAAGDIILPIVAGIAGAIGKVAGVFAALPEPVQTVVVAFLGLVAAAGPVLMVAGSLIKNYALLHGAATKAAGSTGLFARAAGAAATGLGALAVGLGVVELFDQLTGRTGDANDELNVLVSTLSKVGKLELPEGQTMSEGVSEITAAFTELALKIQDTKSSWQIAKDMADWQTDQEFNLKQMSDAFDQVFNTSPDMA
ncbi:MAG TPA: phage tail tape measure protein, partial [Ilumatobacteraceae bacterium]|nr:phage tail tape measure protein [Ilumatobacteraceae bacterium]